MTAWGFRNQISRAGWERKTLSMIGRGDLLLDMKFHRPAVLIGLMTLFCVGVSSAPAQSNGGNPKGKESTFNKPASIQGCYELGTLLWRPDLKLGAPGGDEVFITPPRRIQLLAERGSERLEKNGYLVRPAPGIPASIHRFSYWTPTGTRTIEVVFSTGLSGLVMKPKVDGETLRGKAKTHWDFPRRHQTAQVMARKVDCGKNQ